MRTFSPTATYTSMDHLSDHDLERYHLRMIRDVAELAQFEEHLLACSECAERAEEAADFVDAMRGGIILGDYDLEYPPPPRSSRSE
ncbi:MAG TPA: hypothetical protein VMI94_27975 [Bryobacteraceae bacterium]|nr:hypothetical protein [Bryobacteraceae bacterium]